jgi:hypothetical protein
MANDNYILKKPGLKTDEDFAALRSKGLEYIQNLSSSLWTDYNEHDPGITILEALCYAITELGYRTSLPMRDLLASSDGSIPGSQTFFTAKKILTQSPLNIDDYRKMLIDIQGVQNAWLFFCANSANNLSAEPPIYADCKKSILSYTPVYDTDESVYLQGLYNVLLDLETDPQLGDLNNGDIEVNIYSTTYSAPVNFVVSFPKWSKANPFLLATSLLSPSDYAGVTFTFSSGTLTIKISSSVKIIGAVTLGINPSGFSISDLLNHEPGILGQIVANYVRKIQEAQNIVKVARKKLLAHRNLCEDFVSLNTINDEDIGFCFNLDVTPDSDVESVLANVYLAITNYLEPPVNFYLLGDMTAKGKTMDEIFEGPRLHHGFIDTDELDKSQLTSTIYASELISLIMQVEGVSGVRNFLMSAYNEDTNLQVGKNQAWCLTVSPWYKPVLSQEHSKITIYKNGIPFFANEAATNELYEQLLSQQQSNKLKSTAVDLPVPTGDYTELDEYTSIQYLFPQVYAIGNNTLTAAETVARKAQARQLKAYLLFYDQLLADFFSQLKNAEQLFSTDAIKQTYYAQFVNEFKDFDSIYLKNGSPVETAFVRDVISSQDSTVSPATAWEKLYETNETFVDRRNRFLEHLMARFSESFNDYVFLIYSLNPATQEQTEIDSADLIKNKIEFLQNYPDMSYKRAKGYNYCPTDQHFNLDITKLWNTDNVSGLEKKLCLLGGFSDSPTGVPSFTRRFLRCFGLTDASLQVTITPSGSTNSYSATLTIDGTPYTATANEISKLYTKLVALIPAATLQADCSTEGMYLIEHILLRPRSASDPEFNLADVCLEKDCKDCGNEDPYSFRISVVMPYWNSHFNNMAFRAYFENLARTEAPAHCMLKVCWINQDAMLKFEILYNIWINAMALYYSNPNDSAFAFLADANNNLLDVLQTLHSEYPVATLHDCAESETNPVILGKTILGTTNTQ